MSKACGLGLRLPFPALEFDLICLHNVDRTGWLECRVLEQGSFWFSLHTLAQRYWLCVAMASPVPPEPDGFALKPFTPHSRRVR